jgi:hypothetical protein
MIALPGRLDELLLETGTCFVSSEGFIWRGLAAWPLYFLVQTQPRNA